ncbi:MAG: hypothetical protein GXP09_05090 [Gammaproteobacteria bacterium]|nr:hypothetical protein [Gammaproteobacteria bacterium]
MDEVIKLELLTLEVSDCRLCEAHGMALNHLPAIHRGDCAPMIVIGAQPEKVDIHSRQLFSGSAGKRMLNWLVRANIGKEIEDVLARVYFTTLSKCHTTSGRDLNQAMGHCAFFIERELKLVAPRICVTLGKEPLDRLFRYAGILEDVVGGEWTETELGIHLFPILPDGCRIIPLPKPSSASMWAKDEGRAERLDQALTLIDKLFNK